MAYVLQEASRDLQYVGEMPLKHTDFFSLILSKVIKQELDPDFSIVFQSCILNLIGSEIE